MWMIVFHSTDECTYSCHDALAVFMDKDVAELVKEELNAVPAPQKARRTIYGDQPFEVREIPFFQAESETRVRGIVKSILDSHFPKRP